MTVRLDDPSVITTAYVPPEHEAEARVMAADAFGLWGSTVNVVVDPSIAGYRWRFTKEKALSGQTR